MFRANVGLSRKISREFQSTGYSINLDGEIPFAPDDVEGVLEKVRELFDLAKEAIEREIDRDQGSPCITDSGHAAPLIPSNGKSGEPIEERSSSPSSPSPSPDGSSGHRQGNAPTATEKQIQFILTMGRRSKLSMLELEARIAQVVGRKSNVYDLSKREAGQVIEQLTGRSQTASASR